MRRFLSASRHLDEEEMGFDDYCKGDLDGALNVACKAWEVSTTKRMNEIPRLTNRDLKFLVGDDISPSSSE